MASWSTGSIVTLSSGAPATSRVRVTPANIGAGERPDQEVKTAKQSPSGWWSPTALAPNRIETIRNVGEGILAGPGRFVGDFSAFQ